MRNLSPQISLLALTALLFQSAGATPIITGVVETGGDNEATDTIPAKWTGSTFPISVVDEPFPGAVMGNTYTVRVFGNHAPAFVDRNHRFTNASDAVVIPAYLAGHEYIMSGNDNRDNASYVLDVTVDRAVDAYLLIDNRLGDANGTNPPAFGPTAMQWVLDQGWVPSATGANRTRDISLPDEVGIDEAADGTLNQWYSVYRKAFPAGTLQLRQADNAGQNMYGVVVTPAKTGRVVTVNTINNETPGVGETSLMMALTGLQEGDRVQFNIPGPGPHTIVTPLGGYPLMTANNVTIDGYSQPGSAANSNPVLSGNNAQIKIVLDSTGPGLHSTRLDFPELPPDSNTGYGSSENCMLGVYQADNFTIRGLSFIARRTPGSDEDPSIYAVALIREATNAHVQGCWFGLAPGAGTTLADVKPPASAVAAFRWRFGGDVFSAGAILGTDGDGVTDRAELNVMMGGRITMAIEAPNLRVSGNYVNVYPDGNHFLDIDASYQAWLDVLLASDPGADPDDVTIENFENGRVTGNTLIGTDGNGISDDVEGNVLNHTVYDTHGEFYSDGATNTVVAGNYVGVGIDGVTRAPVSTNNSPNFISLPNVASVRIGSNGDGISDAIEGNFIVGCTGDRFVAAGGNVPIVQRRNRMIDNAFTAIPFADGQNGSYATYYSAAMADAAAGAVPVQLVLTTNGILNGTIPAPSAAYPNVYIDLYTVDGGALDQSAGTKIQPSTYLATFTDNGTNDLNPAANEFSFNIASFNVPNSTYVSVAATYSTTANNTGPDNAVTSPMSNPINSRPILHFERLNADQITFWWLGGPGGFQLQGGPSVTDAQNWLEVPTDNYVNGKSSVTMFIFFNDLSQFFQLISL